MNRDKIIGSSFEDLRLFLNNNGFRMRPDTYKGIRVFYCSAPITGVDFTILTMAEGDTVNKIQFIHGGRTVIFPKISPYIGN